MKINKPSWLALVAFMLPIYSFNAAAVNISKPCHSLASGAYLATIANPDGSFASRAVLTFNADGTLTRTDSNQGGVAGSFNAFTTSLGSWQCDGRRSLHATAINFSLPGVFSAEAGIARSDYQVLLDARKQSIQGHIDVRFFSLTDDPYKTDLPVPAISVTFEGRRIPSK